MTTPRRAREHAYSPKLLAIIAIGAGLVLIAVVIYASQTKAATRAELIPTPTPQPTATWTSYIPTTPQECRDALHAANVAITKANELIEAQAKAQQKQKLGTPPIKESDLAIKKNGELKKLEDEYIKQQNRCLAK